MSTHIWEQAERVTRVATSTTIAARLLEIIQSNNLEPGFVLPSERELAQKFGVSRATMRETLHELVLKGVLVRKQGSGTAVLGTSDRGQALIGDLSLAERDAAEVIDFRNTFEPQIAGYAAKRRSDSDLLVMASHCDLDPETATPEESLEHDRKFHESIANATNNQLLRDLSRATQEWMNDFRKASHSTAEGRRASLLGHREILQAISDGDAEAASTAMCDHISYVGRF